MNPFKEYLEKKAADGGFMAGMASRLSPKNLGKSVGGAVLGAGAAGAVGLAGAAASKLVDAATKARDFRSMLEYDQSLAAAHQENPRLVNQMFSTLRTFNPTVTKDPAVASAIVTQMLDQPGAVPGQMLNMQPLRERGGIIPSMMQSALGGAKPGGGGGHSRKEE